MHGRRSQGLTTTPFIDNIHKVGRKTERSEEVAFKEIEKELEEKDLRAMENQELVQNARQRLMREYARPIIGTTVSCIHLGEAARNYELKNIHLNMLPSFYGMPNEDPLNFIRDFYGTVQTFPLQGLTEDQLRMRCFPYTLKDKAKAWLMTLTPGSLTTWDAIYNKFMTKFYSHQKTSELRAKIATFCQLEGEPFHEAWERFKMLLIQCPHHHYPLQLQNQFFYDGLTMQCQYMVDNAAGGAVGEKTAEETYELFEMLGANSQQKSVRGRKAGVQEVSTSNDMAMQLAELTRQVALLTSKGSANHEVCGICGTFGHGANACPSSSHDVGFEQEQVSMMEAYPRMKNDPYSNTYNPGWRNHPNFSWRNNQNPTLLQRQSQQQGGVPNFQRKPSLEDSLNSFIQVSQETQERNNQRLDSLEASVRRIEVQVGQLAEALVTHQKGKLPSHTEQAKAITILRSGKVIDKSLFAENSNDSLVGVGEQEEEQERGQSSESEGIEEALPLADVEKKENSENTKGETERNKEAESLEKVEKKENEKEKSMLYKAPEPYRPPIPFLGRLREQKYDKLFSEIFDLFSKVDINLPLLDAIRNVPAYAKFFKELVTKKRRFKKDEKVIVSEVASAALKQGLPPKLKDPGSFDIDIKMGDRKVVRAMLDLGASINLMPYSVYLQLGLGELKPTPMTLQLADRSLKYPKGIIEDVLVQIDKLIVPVDFVVLEMEEDPTKDKAHSILLGRPFMATTKTIINVQKGTLSMTVLGETIQLKVFDSSLSSNVSVINNCSFVDEIDPLVCVDNFQQGLDSKIAAKEAINDEKNRGEKGKEKVRLEGAKVLNKATERRPALSIGMNALLLDSRPKCFARMLKSRWRGPYEIVEVHPYGVVELKNPKTDGTFKVSGNRVKPLLEDIPREGVEERMTFHVP